MASTSVEDRLCQTIAGVLGTDPGTLSEEWAPETVDSWDSLNHLNLVMALESEYEISLSPEDALAMQNVGSIRRVLAEYQVPHEEAIPFVDCLTEHIPALKAFVAKSYGAGYVLGVNDAYFRWQFGHTSLGKANDYHLRLAMVDGQIAGCLGYVPLEVNMGDQVLHGCWLANWMVDPDQRHLGLGPLLVRDVSREFEVTLALGPNKDARDILSRMGWTDFGLLRRYVRVLDVRRARVLTESGDFDWPVEATAEAAESYRAVRVETMDRFDERATQLWDDLWANEPSSAGTRRTAQFLNWRYADHPQFAYRRFQGLEDGRVAGFGVYRVEQARGLPVRVGRIVELVGESNVQDSLLRTMLDDAQSQKAAAIDFFCPSPRYSSVMTRHGFLPGENDAAKQIPILYQPIDRRRVGIRFMADLQNVGGTDDVHDWYVTKGDGDQDRPN